MATPRYGGKAVVKIGDWKGVTQLIKGMERSMKAARKKSTMMYAKKGELILKEHIVNQDLPWAPLAESTLRAKRNQPYPTHIWAETGALFNSIRFKVVDHVAYIGIPPNRVARRGGPKLWKVAIWLELGVVSKKIPARPLWQPAADELDQWYTGTLSVQPGAIWAREYASKFGLGTPYVFSVKP